MKRFFDSDVCLLTIIGLGFVIASVASFVECLGKSYVTPTGYSTVFAVGIIGFMSLVFAGIIWHDDKKRNALFQ